jgi:hypothetical protein
MTNNLYLRMFIIYPQIICLRHKIIIVYPLDGNENQKIQFIGQNIFVI